MTLFVTSDTHFGHANIIRYCSRPFQDVVAMNESLIERWNDRVGKKDTVYHLGDFAFMNQEETFNLIRRLNGKLIIVPGNHDKVIHQLANDRAFPFLDPILFELEQPLIEIHHDSQRYVLCHFPIESWHQKERGTIHLHGHTHGKCRNVADRFDIGVDVYGGPVEISRAALETPEGWK